VQVLELTRKFQYNSITLGDPNPALTPEQVKEVFAAQYPELTNSVIEGPVTKGGTATYKFTRAVGSKGAELRCAADVLQEAIRGGDSHEIAKVLASVEGADPNGNAATLLGRVALSKERGVPMPIPPQAYGLFG
jgi:PRTRC genetic system protein C